MYSGLHDPSRWVLPAAMEEAATLTPSATWFTHIDTGETLTFGGAAADMLRVAGFFESMDVRHGDRVAVFMRNSCDFVRAWLGLTRLGAIAVLLNADLHGAFLAHQLSNSDVSLVVADADLVPALEAVTTQAPGIRRVFVAGNMSGMSGGALELYPFSSWRDGQPWHGPMPTYRDIACIMYTSGTTGPAKGVLMPHAHCALYGIGEIDALQIGPDDKCYIVLPLFHANGLLMQLGSSILAGIPAVVRTKFSASVWVVDLRKYGATVTNIMGSIASFILSTGAASTDTDHNLRKIISAPNLAAHEEQFHRRFGIRDIISGFGMTESNIPIWGRIGQPLPGKSGWAYEKYFEVRVVDPDTDESVPAGEPGEIVVRPKQPFGFSAGYYNMADKTVEAWRNLWFHTGDAASMDADGAITYIDRIKDCIRRRGENISATEVEAVVESIDGVAEAAAYAVPADLPGAEDELVIAIVPKPGARPDLYEIASEAQKRLPRFAKPRYVRSLSALPRTATGKVQRAVLKREGIGDAIDLEDAIVG